MAGGENRASSGLPGAFWAAAARGELALTRCRDCGESFFYPRAACPFCHGDAIEWVRASGRGVIYSFALMRRKGEVVSVPARVTLEEGPTILTLLVDGADDAWAIGQPVELIFVATPEQPATPAFRPLRGPCDD